MEVGEDGVLSYETYGVGLDTCVIGTETAFRADVA
jgi:hypothetical protein